VLLGIYLIAVTLYVGIFAIVGFDPKLPDGGSEVASSLLIERTMVFTQFLRIVATLLVFACLLFIVICYREPRVKESPEPGNTSS